MLLSFILFRYYVSADVTFFESTPFFFNSAHHFCLEGSSFILPLLPPVPTPIVEGPPKLQVSRRRTPHLDETLSEPVVAEPSVVPTPPVSASAEDPSIYLEIAKRKDLCSSSHSSLCLFSSLIFLVSYFCLVLVYSYYYQILSMMVGSRRWMQRWKLFYRRKRGS